MCARTISRQEFIIVFFDLETTGFSITDEIIQIAAKYENRIFNEYVIPKSPIPSKITEITGISMIGEQMYHNGRKVEGSSPAAAIRKFLIFLDFLNDFDLPLILVAHNCFKFDGPRIVRLINRCDQMEKLTRVVAGFSDSLPLLRKSLPRKREKGTGYRLAVLAEEFLGSADGAHNAITDVTMLEKIVNLPEIGITANDFVTSAMKVDDMRFKSKCLLNDHMQRLRFFNE